MTSPARQAEADRVEQVFHWALVQIGVATIEDALALWQDVPRSEQAATSARWLSEGVELVMGYRAFTYEVALAYYRLVRALRTGSTVADPRRNEPETISLETLRDEFDALADQIAEEVPVSQPQGAQDGPADPSGGDAPTTGSEAVTDDENALYEPRPEWQAEDENEDDDILLEEIANLDDLIREADEAAEQEAAEQLDRLGIENLLDKLEQIESDKAAEVEAARREAHAQAGARQAAAAERITLNAARGLVYSIGANDPRVLAWARYSQTGTPCGWCAMLISRGAVYRSASTAQRQGRNQEENKYHDNCHCVPIPMFSDEQYANSPLFALNREYQDLWKNGDPEWDLPKNPSLTQWRRYFRHKHERDGKAQAAQAA